MSCKPPAKPNGTVNPGVVSLIILPKVYHSLFFLLQIIGIGLYC